MSDIARRTGVSRTTVSLVLNGRQPPGGHIPEATRQRVLEAAAELGYRRNALLEALVSGQNQMLGFLAGGVEREFIARILAGAMDEAEEADYTLKILRLRDAEIDRQAVERCLEMRLAGVLAVDMGDASLDYLHREMRRHGTPVASANHSFAQPWGIRVISDDVQGCRLAVEHLVQLDHRRIAFLSGQPGLGMAALREEGYRTAVREHGLALLEGYLRQGGWDVEAAESEAQELLSREGCPTAIFCADDRMAMGVQRAARRLGVAMPRDLSVVGFADLSVAALADPPLTTISQPFEEMGRAAVRRLLERVWGRQDGEGVGDEPVEEVLPTRLVVRASTAPAPS